jgi:hypothetical protein
MLWGFVSCAGRVMVRSLRRMCATALHQAFALGIATAIVWAFVPPAAAQRQPGLIITNGNIIDCLGNQACITANGIANVPNIFAQACKATGGTLSGNQCLFAVLPSSDFRPLSFINIAEDIFEAHLLEQAKAAAASASQISESAVQTAIRDIRDSIQDKASAADKAAPQGLGARQARSQESPMMGLTRSPTAVPSPIAMWVQGYVDREWRDSNLGFLDGRTTTTAGAIGGIDHTTYRLFSPNDALVVGLLAGVTQMHTTSVIDVKTRIDGPSLGVYGVYVNGGFSVDFNAKVDFLALDQSSALPISSDLRTYTTAANINYKFDVGGGWIEPTAGAIYTVTRWDNVMSALDGHTVRVQGGVRFGQSFSYGAVTIEPTLLGLLYSDVVIEGGNINNVGVPLAPTDEGKLFEQASLKLNFDFGSGLSTSIEGEVRHGSLDHGAEVVGAAGRVGLRYRW